MRGLKYSTDRRLPRRDLEELSDLLALRLYNRLGWRAYSLGRRDVAELIAPHIADLTDDDQRSLAWMVWDLLQEGMDVELGG